MLWSSDGTRLEPVRLADTELVQRNGNLLTGPIARPTLPGLILTDDLVLPKTSGNGIRVDPAAATFGWRDLLGYIHIRVPGANDPVLAVHRGNIRQFQFSNALMNEVFAEYHLPHDYLPGSNIHIHAHWSQIVVDTGAGGAPGTVKWSFETTYAKGHGQSPFSVPGTVSVTQQASAVQYTHMLAEVQLSAAAPGAGQLDTDDLEPDGLILVRAWSDPADAADTLDQAPFLHFVDVHYQSTNVATKQRAPNFYV